MFIARRSTVAEEKIKYLEMIEIFAWREAAVSNKKCTSSFENAILIYEVFQ